ncbi:MAG: hypothetical protein ACTSP4_03805 [Candidatus Hodarchaeales archaeon]
MERSRRDELSSALLVFLVAWKVVYLYIVRIKVISSKLGFL